MWVTQSYLGTPDKDASTFVYYLYENYNSEQVSFTKLVQNEMETMGEIFKSDVTLLMPNPRYAASVQSEFVGKFRARWSLFDGKLPGLVITQRPMSDPDVLEHECIYFPFDVKDMESVKRVCGEVRSLLLSTLSYKHANRPVPKEPSFFQILYDALEAKPGAFGFRLDLKKVGRRRG